MNSHILIVIFQFLLPLITSGNYFNNYNTVVIQLDSKRVGTYVADAKVVFPSLVNPSYYAMATAPRDFVFIAKSIQPNAGYGVFANRRIEKDMYFGPYDGYRHNNTLALGDVGRYAWLINRSSGDVTFVDAFDPNQSNWLRFINCAIVARQQNLFAIQHRNEIFYMATRDIEKGEELLVYYGDQYAKQLGVNLTNYAIENL